MKNCLQISLTNFANKNPGVPKQIAVFSGMSAANTVVENGGRVVLLVFRLRSVILLVVLCFSLLKLKPVD